MEAVRSEESEIPIGSPASNQAGSLHLKQRLFVNELSRLTNLNCPANLRLAAGVAGVTIAMAGLRFTMETKRRSHQPGS